MRMNLFSRSEVPEPEPENAEAPQTRTGRTFPADEVAWGITIRNGYDELDDPFYHRGLTQHAYLEASDNAAICGFRPPQSGPRTRRRARLGMPTAGVHPMCGTCARMVVAPRPRVPVPIQSDRPVVAVPVAVERPAQESPIGVAPRASISFVAAATPSNAATPSRPTTPSVTSTPSAGVEVTAAAQVAEPPASTPPVPTSRPPSPPPVAPPPPGPPPVGSTPSEAAAPADPAEHSSVESSEEDAGSEASEPQPTGSEAEPAGPETEPEGSEAEPETPEAEPSSAWAQRIEDDELDPDQAAGSGLLERGVRTEYEEDE